MYEIAFTKNQLDLIGECVLQTVRDLRKASDMVLIADATQSLETTILRCNEILKLLAEVDYE